MSALIHGRSGKNDLTYRSWMSMRARCNSPSAAEFPRYGGSGITVCARWQSFDAFLSDLGERPSAQYSLDRINPKKGYEPDNCRWATWKEQRRNQTRNRPVIRSDGLKFRTMIEAAE